MNDAVGIDTGSAHRRFPARSKMLDMYAADITRMLAGGKYESAETIALAVPHICAALTDSNLQSSCDAYRSWCAQWIRPPLGEDVYHHWCVRCGECERQRVPFSALQALRLRRQAREASPPPLVLPLTAESHTHAAEATAYTLLRALLRWSDQHARHDALVQTNLAHLGVLR